MTRKHRAPGEKPRYLGRFVEGRSDVVPRSAKDELGIALSVAQFGAKHPHAKPWKGEGPGVFEVVSSYRGDAYRAVYTVRFEKAVYSAARISEEIARRNQDAANRCGVDFEALASCLRRLRGEICQGIAERELREVLEMYLQISVWRARRKSKRRCGWPWP